MRKKATKKIRYMVDTTDAISELPNISPKCWEFFKGFCSVVKNQESIASHHTHYDHLQDWYDPIRDYIHNALDKVGFKNGDREYNDKFPDIRFWWLIYGVGSSIIWSPNLVSITENHHSSAYERAIALRIELSAILQANNETFF